MKTVVVALVAGSLLSGCSEEDDGLCGLGGGDEPWLEIRQSGVPLQEADNKIFLECGGQGSFMFDFQVETGGFSLGGGTHAKIAAKMDVDGFTRFFDQPNHLVDLSCRPDEYSNGGGVDERNRIIVFPPDEIADLTQLHDLSTSLEFTLLTDDGETPFTAGGTIVAVDDGSWECCAEAFCD